MKKLKQAQEILRALGLPKDQQNEISALTLLALCAIGPKGDWAEASQKSLTISKGIMPFIKNSYKRTYAPNTRETFRRQVLHQFIQAQVVDYNPDNPSLPTNSPNAHYAISKSALNVIKNYGGYGWQKAVNNFISEKGSLIEIYHRRREGHLLPVTMPNGTKLKLSPGEHNSLQIEVIEKFIPQFAPGAQVLYLGDTEKKDLFIDYEVLKVMNIPITQHDKLPDILIFDRVHNWLLLIEVVTSHGPMTAKRVRELEKMLGKCSALRTYITVFLSLNEFRKHIRKIAWETEVWIAEIPDHMIHFNGDKFLGPH